MQQAHTTHKVGCTTCTLTTIQAAIIAAADGDIIHVYPGIYTVPVDPGYIEITVPNLTIQAVDDDGNVIDAKDYADETPLVSINGGGDESYVFDIRDSNLGVITIEGFHIFNQLWGAVWLWWDAYDGTSVHVVNNHIIANLADEGQGTLPIYIEGEGSSVIGNLIQTAAPWDQTSAIYVFAASNVEIKDNIIQGSWDDGRSFAGIGLFIFDDTDTKKSNSGNVQNEMQSHRNQPMNWATRLNQREPDRDRPISPSMSNILIENNEIIGCFAGISVGHWDGFSIDNLEIINNEIEGAFLGIYMESGAVTLDKGLYTIGLDTIEGNSFKDNEFHVDAYYAQFLEEIDFEDVLSDNTFDRAVVIRENPILYSTIFGNIGRALSWSSPGLIVNMSEGTYAEDIVDDIGVTFSPGLSPGCVTVNSLTVTNTSTFIIDIWGDDGACNSENGWDKWTVNGNLNLNNAGIEIRLNGYVPEAGKEFIIFEYGSLTGEFDMPQLIEANGSYFLLDYGSGTDGKITLTTLAPMFKMEIKTTGDR